MKKVLAILALLSMTCGATEILSEYYVMEKVLPLFNRSTKLYSKWTRSKGN